MKVVYCIIDTSQIGGMERIISCKANYLADELGYDVTIITTDRENKENFYHFSDKIKFIDFGINYKKIIQYPFWERLKEQIKKRKEHKNKLEKYLLSENPDIIISTYTHEFTLLPKIKTKSKKIGEIHFSKQYNAIEANNRKQSFFNKMMSCMAEHRKHLFISKYDKFIVLTEVDKKKWRKITNVECINNILPFYPRESAELNIKRIISVGRLTFQKGYDMLIEAWMEIILDFPEWKLDIFGAGEDYGFLSSQITLKKLENSVTINKPTDNIVSEYLNSSVYVMSSRYEGFPMTLIEAQSCGLPCISFDCPNGPAEIIRDGEDGFLIESGNIQELADKMKLLMSNSDLRKEMGMKAKQNVIRFSPAVIMKKWDLLFHNLIQS